MRGVYSGDVHLNVTIGNRGSHPIGINVDEYAPGCVIMDPVNMGENVTTSPCGGTGDVDYANIHGVCQYKECLTDDYALCAFPFK